MKALVYTAPGEVHMAERPRPQAGPNESVIRVERAGICGSDISGFLGHSPRRKPPLILSHELVGRLSDGRRVVANPLISCGRCANCRAGFQNLCATWRLLGMDQTQGAFAEEVVLPNDQIFEIPGSLSSGRAILAEPLANVVHLFRMVGPSPFFRMAIVGAGTMGMLALQAGLRLGGRETAVFDVNAARLATAEKLGAGKAIDVHSVTDVASLAASGFDLVIDASGSSAARQMSFDLCRPGGQVALLGMADLSSKIDFVTSIRKEHRVVMSFGYTPIDFAASLELLIKGWIDLEPWTVEMPLEQGKRPLIWSHIAPAPRSKRF